MIHTWYKRDFARYY